jgi:Fe-Mn family superoxide dismutase
MSVKELFAQFDTLPEPLQPIVRNFGGGHINHSFFWKTLRVPRTDNIPATTSPFAQAIDSDFGSFAKFKDQFSTAALNHLGSGWAWVVRQ